MREFIIDWRTNKLEYSLKLCFLATVFTSFFGSAILSVTVPGIGEVFPFRVFLAVTAVLYLVWAIREKNCFWKDASAVERWCYIFIAIMLVYSVLSLPRAIDFMFSFRKLFNLCFDLCFFFLMLHLCRDRKLLHCTLRVSVTAVAILAVMGIYEIFNGGIFNNMYDGVTFFPFLMSYYQYPLTVFPTCNEYAATMLFIASIVFLAWAARKDTPPRRQLWIVALVIPFVWFLMLASSARLCQVAFCILLVGIAIYFLLCGGKKQVWVPVVAILLVGGVQFAHQYLFIVPPIQQYIVEMKESHQQQGPVSPDDPTPQKPTLNIGDPRKESLKDQFIAVDEETGNNELRTEGSAGVRVHLLLHAFNCFKESHGLGVGLGNTETLAARRAVVPAWADNPQNSIHCFIARIIADYGIFVLIPLCVIAFLLLKRMWALFKGGLEIKDRRLAGVAVLLLFTLLLFPVVSTAASDAQDLIPMWIYLAVVVLFAARLDIPARCDTPAFNKTEKADSICL